MGYCTTADVQALRPQLTLTTVSKPSLADVEVAIGQVSDHINGIMAGLSILVPLNVTVSPIAYGYVKACVQWAVAGLMEDQQRAGVSRTSDGQVQNDYYSQYLDCIKAITEKPLILADALQATGAAAQRKIESFFTHNPTDDVEQGMVPKMRDTSAANRFSIRQEF